MQSTSKLNSLVITSCRLRIKPPMTETKSRLITHDIIFFVSAIKAPRNQVSAWNCKSFFFFEPAARLSLVKYWIELLMISKKIALSIPNNSFLPSSIHRIHRVHWVATCFVQTSSAHECLLDHLLSALFTFLETQNNQPSLPCRIILHNYFIFYYICNRKLFNSTHKSMCWGWIEPENCTQWLRAIHTQNPALCFTPKWSRGENARQKRIDEANRRNNDINAAIIHFIFFRYNCKWFNNGTERKKVLPTPFSARLGCALPPCDEFSCSFFTV